MATSDQMRALLQDACDIAGSQKEWARLNKVSDAYVSDVLHGRRDVSDTICKALGYERIISFKRRER
jgi:DNA-binding transcriptional regulator YdaS (Cro superfamily)